VLLEGMQLGRYRLSRLLGSGGMGEVYLGEDTHIHRQVAVKVTRAEATPYPNSEAAKQATRLFQREVRAIAMLDHPYILPLFDYGEQDTETTSLTYMVMPYREEGSLSMWLRQRSEKQTLSPQEVAHFIKQAASALAYAHQHHIIHQDVKLSNFLIRSNETNPQLPDLLLADFGVAKFTSASASVSQSSRGTPTYMAPEQWSGQPVAASDQYALAIMAYQLLTGSLPFQGRQELVMYMHFSVQPQPPGTLNSSIPKDIDIVILHALAKKPEERFASISAFANAFHQALSLPELPKITNSLRGSAQSGVSQPLNTPPVSDADIRATVAISRDEVARGTTRTLNLPGGRRITVPIPSGIPDGQVIRLESQGDTGSNGTTGALVLTISIAPDETQHAMHNGNENETVASDPGSSNIQTKSANMIASRRISARFRPLRLPRSKVALIIGLVLLIVLVSSGVFYFKYFNFIHKISLLNAGIANPYPPGTGTLALNDPLTDNSLGYFWGEGGDSNGGNCGFTSSAYLATVSTSGEYHYCTAASTSLGNFAYEVQMTIAQGDQAGIVFRVNDTNHTFYFFHIDSQGNYALDIHNINCCSTLKSGNTAINTTSGQSNILGVVANGSQIDLYVNHQKIDSVTDTTYSQGEVGVAAYDSTNPTEAIFTNAKVWTF
jgi:eukaryotic-like serine/threonine-protein kinase